MIAIEWTAPARADLESIDDYLNVIDPALADRTIDRIEAAGGFLTENPAAGPISVGEDIRKWIVRRTPYLLFYRDAADRIEILRVRHDREGWQA